MARSGPGSWRVTAAWHQEMSGGRADPSKEVRAAWAKLLGCLAALGALAMALPRPVDLVSTVVDALTGGGQASGGAAATGVRAAGTAPGFMDAAENSVLLAAGLVVWALLLWALAIVIIAGVGRLPGSGGRAAQKALRRIAPAAAGRLVIAAVGVTAIAGAAGCAAPDSTGPAVVSVANAAPASGAASSTDPSTPLVDIDWPDPIDGSSSTETPAPAAGDSPAGTASNGTQPTGSTDQSSPQPDLDPAAPVSTARAAANPNGDPTDTTQPESTPPGPAAPDAPSNPAAGPAGEPGTETPAPAPDTAAEADGSVIVRTGDSLWAIAARHLPEDATDTEIDTAWRAWYSANVEVIGADPDLIIPGQHLLPDHSEMRP